MAHVRSLSYASRSLQHNSNVFRYHLHPVRSLHQAAVVSAAKKQKTSSSEDDLFSADSDDLFSDKRGAERKSKATRSPSAASRVKSTESSTFPTQSQEKTKGKPTAAERLARFNKLYQFVSESIGRRPINAVTQVRTSAWTHLFGLAKSKDQLQKIVKLFPQWKEGGREWTPQISRNFVRRCEELRCPQLALQVFSDHPKYGLDLATLPAARQLLHSLHAEHPLSDSITVSALYKVHNLPPISSDLVSCAMLASACFKYNTPDSVTVARGLVPSLQQLLKNTRPEDMALPKREDKALRARAESKEKAWLAWTLGKIEKALEKQGEDFAWLRQWRVQSGHLQSAA